MGLTDREKDQGMGDSRVRGRGLWPCWIPQQSQPSNSISAGVGRLVTGPFKRMAARKVLGRRVGISPSL